METLADKLRALSMALAMHALCVIALVIGLWWTPREAPLVSLSGPIIEATLVGPTAAPKPKASVTKPVPTTPKPVETPLAPALPSEESPPPSEPERQDILERERVAALAQQKIEQEKREKEQEQRKRQEQVRLEEEKRQKQEQEAKKQREAEQQKRKLEQEKQAQLAKQKADQEKRERERQQQLADREAAQNQTGQQGQDESLRAQYVLAIGRLVESNWIRPENAPKIKCNVYIIQIPGGHVISAKVVEPCNADAMVRTSIEQAVLRSDPLPYRGFEKVFSRDITFEFAHSPT